MGAAFIFGPLIVGVLLLCGWSVYRLFNMWLVEAMLSGWELLLILTLVVSLIALSFAMAGLAAVGPLILLALVVGAIPLLPVLGQAVGKRRMVREDIAKYQAALERQPDVPYPHRKLGEIYEEREDWDRAIEHYQAYVEQHTTSAEVRRRLERCLARRRRRDMGLQRCPVCGAENPGDAVRCAECGFYLSGGAEIIDTLTTPRLMRLWRWLIIVFLVPGIIIGLLGNVLPPVLSLIMLAISVIATILFMTGRVYNEGEV